MKLLKSDLFGRMTLEQACGPQPIYRFITRRLPGWADREGAGDHRF